MELEDLEPPPREPDITIDEYGTHDPLDVGPSQEETDTLLRPGGDASPQCAHHTAPDAVGGASFGGAGPPWHKLLGMRDWHHGGVVIAGT